MRDYLNSVRSFWSRGGGGGAPFCCTGPSSAASPGKRWVLATVSAFFFVSLCISIFIYWNDVYDIAGNYFFRAPPATTPTRPAIKIDFPFNCSNRDPAITCPTFNQSVSTSQTNKSSAVTCPQYTRWIQEDLRPWNMTGITREMVDRARDFADFRVVIVKGKVYVERYQNAYQTRDVFTIWGIVQLLRLYPGKVPDLDLMFWCGDMPAISKRKHNHVKHLPPVFHYCGDDKSYDIVFPDWSYWGWIEVNIKPWMSMVETLRESNNKTKWKDREPYAYWRGNPYVSRRRRELLKCNISKKHEWNARLYGEDWGVERQEGFKHSNLEDQCTHSLVSKTHYWPIRTSRMCKDVKSAVEWGNTHTDKAQAIAETASKFIQEDLKMEFVYDYMFHLLSEYGKLFKYQPTIPPGAVEVCSETTLACPGDGLWRNFMVDSLVTSPKATLPCTIPI
ncbi:hypothetical protein I3760_01G053900 [Carya illinoinensis]|uniref:Glycosyl transferase CAP10 domain-containing protein n=1 Tax=Carya illinoinensis TaxID=32201 RepID=A0A922FVL3_CARIL|nr:hypothetical protein I3760_01G053900 [Carya illinoinensis]KAG6729934.1 hypothetical protein I3842_01G055600 [Carya illinoinensis]